jgi:hypothetical protein
VKKMEKWEHIRFRFLNNYVDAFPQARVDLAPVFQKLPNVKMETRYGHTEIIRQSDWDQVWQAILEFLEAQGWEGFAVDEGYWYFKRKVTI